MSEDSSSGFEVLVGHWDGEYYSSDGENFRHCRSFQDALAVVGEMLAVYTVGDDEQHQEVNIQCVIMQNTSAGRRTVYFARITSKLGLPVLADPEGPQFPV